MIDLNPFLFRRGGAVLPVSDACITSEARKISSLHVFSLAWLVYNNERDNLHTSVYLSQKDISPVSQKHTPVVLRNRHRPFVIRDDRYNKWKSLH